MKDIFISYRTDANEATEFVKKIVDDFEKIGITCWYAERDQKEELPGAITRAIRECKVFLLVLDKKACHSAYIKSEVALASRRLLNYESISFFPCWIDKSEAVELDMIRHLVKPIGIEDISSMDKAHISNMEQNVCNILRYNFG